MISNSGGSESDGGTECGQSAIGVVRTGNVLPSTLLKTGNINAGGMVANNSGGGGNTRRAVSTLIGGTSGGNNSVGIGMNSPASATAKTAAAAQQQQQHTPPHHQPPLHAKAKEFAKVLYKYEAAATDELSLPEGAIVTVATRQCEDDGWFVAELPDGRCGLFPDNFVNFYPAELTGSGIHLHQQQTSPNNHSYPAPPSLPAKPQKFVQPQLQQQQLNSPASVPPPIASARDSLSALVVNVMSSSSANDSNNPGNPLTRSMELTESKKGIATSDNKMENISGTTTTNNNAGNSAHKNKVFDTTGTDGTAAARPTAPTSTATTAEGSNRHSRIVAIQDILKQQLPPGRLPMQRPPSLGAKPADNVEPKMPGMESPVSEAQQQQKQQQDAFVKSRTKIAPTNKRPPSKVNSAAVVASESANNNTSTSTPWIQKSFPSSPLSSPTTPNKPQQQLPPLSLDTKILQDIHQPTSTTVSATTNAGCSNATAGASKSTVFPSQSGGPPSPSAPHQSVQTLLCTLGEEQKQPEVQLQLKASPHFQPPIVPPASSSSHFKAAHSPSNSSVASAATDITMGSSSVFPVPPSSSASTSVQWISRADFDRFAEECQRKFADMQAEIRELRQRVETAQNK